MGSHSVTHSVPASIVTREQLKSYWSSYISDLISEHGTDPYNGTFSTTRGLQISNEVFTDSSAAETYILERTQKWENALAVRVKEKQVDYRVLQQDAAVKASAELLRQVETESAKVLREVAAKLSDKPFRNCPCCKSKIAMVFTRTDGTKVELRSGKCPVCQNGSLLTKTESAIVARARGAQAKAQAKDLGVRNKVSERLAKKLTAKEFWFVGGWAAS